MKQLNKRGYHQSEITPVFWMHNWRLICFSLCIDDFGVKYVVKNNVEHLITVLRDHYKISHNWSINRNYYDKGIGRLAQEMSGLSEEKKRCFL